MISNDTYHYILYKLGATPQIIQGSLAHELGNGLGRAGYCPQALIEKALVKARTVSKGDHIKQLSYGQTPWVARIMLSTPSLS